MGKEPDEIRREIEDTRGRMGETVEAIGYKADVPARARDSVTDTKNSVVESIRNAKDHVVGSIVGTKESVGGSMSQAGSSVSQSVGSATSSVSGTVSGAGHSVAEAGPGVAARVGEVTPTAQDLRQGAQRGVGLAQENPLGLAIGSVAVGFIAGLMVPATKIERQKVGPLADQVVEKARETGEEAVERGKHIAQQAASTARQVAEETKNTAEEAAQRGIEEVRSTAQEQGQELASSAQENASEIASSGQAGDTGGTDQVSGETPASAGSEIPTAGPEIDGSDLIEGNTGIGTTGPSESHNPGGAPTI